MEEDLLSYFKSQWNFARSLTNDLLEELTNAELLMSPHPSVGPWWKQFRHIGRVQENYLKAIENGVVNFGVEGATYNGGASKIKLQEYLALLDDRLNSALNSTAPTIQIDWYGEPKSLAHHLLALTDHEILHHGQWIVYRSQMGGRFPESWSAWGFHES